MRRHNTKPNSKWHARKKMFKDFESRDLSIRKMMKHYFNITDLNYKNGLKLDKRFA